MIPACRTIRVMEGGLLAYYRRSADSRFWDEHWSSQLSGEHYRAAQRGDLGFIERPCVTWLPREGKILEAGCGRGQVLLALRVRGWDAEGVEWGSRTVQAVRTLLPDLPIRLGDVTRLDVPDASYAGYVSLGVMEHRREGPEPYLKEAYRVLKPGGMALLSVPYFHAIRAWKARLGCYRGSPDGLEFYQYAFPRWRFAELLRAAGFVVVARYAYDGLKTLRDELPRLRPILRFALQRPRLGPALQARLRNAWFGHMLLLVGQKPLDGRP
ncbi:MAG: class I SAM-dependent methyltransferase [Thermoguttaceae bacterium]